MNPHRLLRAIAGLALALTLGTIVHGQVGKGILDLNAMSEKELAALPNMTPAIAKAFVGKRPFNSIVDANAFLLSQGLTQEQATAIYDKAFIHLNLNTATGPEILLIPRIAKRMTVEFAEYRPWKSWAQFDKEIGKYVKQNPGELDRLRMYVFIPINLNTASDEDIMTIPGMTPRMLREFKEYRPWTSKAQFDKEIGKYLTQNPGELARLWRYVTIQ
jgi:DNA uptake protein ComE-like DNA-binding protein